jgi:hypothetical protein
MRRFRTLSCFSCGYLSAAAEFSAWIEFRYSIYVVIANEFRKSLCVRICPEIASFTRTAHDAEKDHRIYSILDGAIVSSKSKPFVDCIQDCIVLGYLPPRLG